MLRGSPPKIYVGHFHWFKNNKIVIHRYFSYIFWGNGPFWHPQVPYPRQFPGRDREHLQEFFIVRQPWRRRFGKFDSVGHLDGIQLSASHSYLDPWECARICLTTHLGRGMQSRLQPCAGKASPERRRHSGRKAQKVFWLLKKQWSPCFLKVYLCVFLPMETVDYIYMYCRKQNLILLSVHQGVWDLYSRCNKSMLETL